MCIHNYHFSLWFVLRRESPPPPSRMVVLLIMTTSLALRESLALESGVGTLRIIHNLHNVLDIKYKKTKSTFHTNHYMIELQLSLEGGNKTKFKWFKKKKKLLGVQEMFILQYIKKKKEQALGRVSNSTDV